MNQHDGTTAAGVSPSSGAPAAPMLEMRGITKRFPGVIANSDVDLVVQPGHVHTLLGENGAGKSTLVKILYGLYRPDEGTVRIQGEQIDVTSPADAIRHGIGMIHQHFMLVPTLTVAENVALGLHGRRGLADMGPVRRRLVEVSEQHGLEIDPDAYIWQLAVGERQRAEILKALYREARLLVLDEPTAVLTPPEVTDLFATLRSLTNEGRGLIFISHKLAEVMEISDEITVLRDGRVVGRTTPAETTREGLASMMVGREVRLGRDVPPQPAGDDLLVVDSLRVQGDRGNAALEDFSVRVASGEIVGIAGVSGNGQRELAEAIFGLRPAESGAIEVGGVPIDTPSPKRVRRRGVAFVPEERMRHGAVGELTVSENLMLVEYEQRPYVRAGLLQFRAIAERCRDLVQRFAVKTPSIATQTSHLSGGNIQKVVIAREFSSDAEVLIVAQPTRGIDIGAAEYVHERLLAKRAAGAAILLISEDLDEAMQLSDRIVVLFQGRAMCDLPRAEATTDRVGLLMTGVSEDEPAAV
ncbi:ABC transporter ATP-binding protein [Candidatus Poriferisodalis sp.]|uniref:ABC transporter ATP-binding protein n=1 Tax=Candidatus Poriferisodalis sp. TaxID=3101277 RepID=UPI003B5B4B14